MQRKLLISFTHIYPDYIRLHLQIHSNNRILVVCISRSPDPSYADIDPGRSELCSIKLVKVVENVWSIAV